MKETKSAYNKLPLEGTVPIGVLGIDGDEHVYKDHGGVDAALCAYPMDHYPFWENLDLKPKIGDFGENLSVRGLLEDEATIGMQLQGPSGLTVEITEPRAPCFKVGRKFDFSAMPVIMAKEGNTGWMMRVLVPGEVSLLDKFEITDQGSPITVSEANRVLNHEKRDLEGAARVLEQAHGLSEVSKRILNARLEKAS